jgi:hypothetical protein
MPYIYPKNVVPPLRHGLIEFARQINPTHDLTLNFHKYYRPEIAVALLTKWYRHILQRLFGRQCYQLPREQLIEFVAFPEFSLAGYPHYHCPIRIPASHLSYFQRIAADRWKAIVPTSSLYLQPIGQTERDQAALFDYVTKSSSAKEVIHSSMLLPVM